MHEHMESVEALWADFPTTIRTAEDYIHSLRGRRMNVYFMGERVPEPVDGRTTSRPKGRVMDCPADTGSASLPFGQPH